MEKTEFPIVICGFPGIGKSYAVKQLGEGYHDSDSSKFSWIDTAAGRVRNPNFPEEYIQHIKSLKGVALVSSHREVRDALAYAGIPYLLCYPEEGLKDEYMQRYLERGSPETFICMLAARWDDWVYEMTREERAKRHIVLKSGEHLSDVLKDAVAWEECSRLINKTFEESRFIARGAHLSDDELKRKVNEFIDKYYPPEGTAPAGDGLTFNVTATKKQDQEKE